MITDEPYQEWTTNFSSYLEAKEQPADFRRCSCCACNKLNNTDVEHLWWSHYFSKLLAYSITGLIANGFLFGGF
jgi:hypothetical protein